MNVCITGGEGYIGTNLCDMLEYMGYVPFSYDLKSGQDITNSDDLWEYLKEMEIQKVFHLAAIPGIAQCDKFIYNAISSNIDGTAIISSHCKLLNIPFLMASSFAVNGGHGIYADTKYIGEKLTLRQGGRVCRIANVFGGTDYVEKKTTVVAKLMNGTFKLEGDGNQTRDFIHVEDVCRAMVEIIEEPMGIYRISSGVITSINDLLCLYDVCSNNKNEFERIMRGRYHYENNRCWSKLV
jgi:nucleoside-diphosphate-sugar epimerase